MCFIKLNGMRLVFLVDCSSSESSDGNIIISTLLYGVNFSQVKLFRIRYHITSNLYRISHSLSRPKENRVLSTVKNICYDMSELMAKTDMDT